MAILLLSNFAWASGDVNLNVKPSEKEIAMVEIIKNPLTEVEVEVTNDFGNVVFYKKISEPVSNYIRKYDFSALDDGNYTLSVNSFNEVNESRFKIDRGLISVENARKYVEPHFKVEGNIFKMSYLNHSMESTNLYVFDRNIMLYHKNIDPEFAINEGLDLSKLFPGEYQILFANGQNNYEYTINVK